MKRAGSLVFAPPEATADLGPLPVRVRSKKTGEIVGSGVTGVPITVPVGSYYVSMVLPDGREIGSPAPVRATAADTLEAAFSLDAPAPAASGAAMAAPPSTMATPPVMARDVTKEAVTYPAAIWRGHWFAQWESRCPTLDEHSGEPLILSDSEPNVLVHTEGSDALIVLTLADRVRCTVVPYDECAICADYGPDARSIWAFLNMASGTPCVDYRSLTSDETNALLGFVEAGVLTEMVTVSDEFVKRGEAAMYGSQISVLRAVTGAYVLLRANALEGVERWLDQLGDLAPMLPDLAPLRVELLARLGRHDEAVAALHAALDGPCPWFRAGLSYMLERLRLYVDVSNNKAAAFNLEPGDYPRFLAAQQRLERMLPMMVTSRYIATFDLPIVR